jgi:hypothetical protein
VAPRATKLVWPLRMPSSHADPVTASGVEYAGQVAPRQRGSTSRPRRRLPGCPPVDARDVL